MNIEDLLSEELLSEVLNKNITKSKIEEGNIVYFGELCDTVGCDCSRRINIYELAHKKCKEWAYTKHNRYLKSYPSKSYDGDITYTCEVVAQNSMHLATFPGKKSEHEAIFRACEWLKCDEKPPKLSDKDDDTPLGANPFMSGKD